MKRFHLVQVDDHLEDLVSGDVVALGVWAVPAVHHRNKSPRETGTVTFVISGLSTF